MELYCLVKMSVGMNVPVMDIFSWCAVSILAVFLDLPGVVSSVVAPGKCFACAGKIREPCREEEREEVTERWVDGA